MCIDSLAIFIICTLIILCHSIFAYFDLLTQRLLKDNFDKLNVCRQNSPINMSLFALFCPKIKLVAQQPKLSVQKWANRTSVSIESDEHPLHLLTYDFGWRILK